MNKRSFNKILVANRGEISLRIIRTIHEMGKTAVAVYSEDDSDLPFVSKADEAYSLGNGSLEETYLNQEKIIRIALLAGADAIHPAYGFLSENPGFAGNCRKNNIVFIGPSEEHISLMGNKVKARKLAHEAGLPVPEGLSGTPEEIIARADSLHYPLMVKPADGGGGKGMYIVNSPVELTEALHASSREAMSYFGTNEVFAEVYLPSSRHIEVQILADHHGNTLHLFDRECSLQRRHQKIVEEAPSPSLDQRTRELILSFALSLVKSLAYTGAGTVEFLLTEDREIFFLEMNTRIQVEHPVTEVITEIDLIKEQITVAQGFPLSVSQGQIGIKGHAIEVRLYAEDPANDFIPSVGKILALDFPATEGLRVDNGYLAGNTIHPRYDPMLAKIISRGRNREEAINRLIAALKGIYIAGPKNNRDYLLALMQNPDFRENRINTTWIRHNTTELNRTVKERADSLSEARVLSAALMIALQQNTGLEQDSVRDHTAYWRLIPEMILRKDKNTSRLNFEMLRTKNEVKIRLHNKKVSLSLQVTSGNHYILTMDDQTISFRGTTDGSDIYLDFNGIQFKLRRMDIPDPRYLDTGSTLRGEKSNEIEAPLPGKIVAVTVKEGQSVNKGETLMVIESMKMENRIISPKDGIVSKVYVREGQGTDKNKLLILLE